MRGAEWARSLIAAGPPPVAEDVPAPDLADLLADYRARYGRHAARELAAETGIHQRSIERYYKHGRGPTRAPARNAIEAAYGRLHAPWMRDAAGRHADQVAASSARHRRDTADFLRLITKLWPGKVTVRNTSGPSAKDSKRTIPELDRMGRGMTRVAQAWEDGDEEAAEAHLSAAILDRYGELGRVASLGSYLEIVDYTQGIDYA